MNRRNTEQKRWVYHWLLRVALLMTCLIAVGCGLWQWWTGFAPVLLPASIRHGVQLLGSGVIIGYHARRYLYAGKKQKNHARKSANQSYQSGSTPL